MTKVTFITLPCYNYATDGPTFNNLLMIIFELLTSSFIRKD